MITPLNMFGTPPAWLLLAGGAALGWVRNFWTWLYGHTVGQVTQRIMVSVTVEEYDHAEAWLWLSHWVEERLRSRRIASLQLRRKATVDSEGPVEIGQRPSTEYELVPAYGVYPFLWHQYLVVFNSRKDEQPQGNSNSGNFFNNTPRRQVNLTVWGTRNRNLLLDIIQEARELWERDHPAAQQYYSHRWSYWNSRPLSRRTAETIYLPEGLYEDILTDAHRFLQSRAMFEELGIPWRRGYLLYGPPGTGKTTLVHVLATELRLPLYYLSLAAITSRNDLASLLDSVRPGSIVLIEDIDCIAAAAARMNEPPPGENASQQTAEPAKVQPTTSEKITPSDLLNQIDGIVASEGRILIMTTNYPQNLDVALVRPGRVDRRWHIDYARAPEIRRFYRRARSLGHQLVDEDEFVSSLGPNPTIAAAQVLLLKAPEREEVIAL